MRPTLNPPLASAIAMMGACLILHAQWLNEPMKGAPRTPDGEIAMTAPAQKQNGFPDLSGIWQVRPDPRPAGPGGLGESGNSRYFRDVLSDYKAGDEPLTPLGNEVLKRNIAGGLALNPAVNCLPDALPRADLLPEPFKVIQSQDLVVLLYEVGTTFRQIFADGRKHPVDPTPSWNGYSVGKWEKDTFVVETIGFNDKSWLDANRRCRPSEGPSARWDSVRWRAGGTAARLVVREPGSGVHGRSF
jgi:hypothetical protein